MLNMLLNPWVDGDFNLTAFIIYWIMLVLIINAVLLHEGK